MGYTMPIYEYRCDKCEETTEVLQKVGEDAPGECPHCGAKKALKKAVSNSAFHLKGGGWYKDLYSSTKPSDDKSSSSTSKPLSKTQEGATNTCGKKCDKD